MNTAIILPQNMIPGHLKKYFQKTEPCSTCFLCVMVQVFRECWRVLRDDGTLWVNIGDSYNASGRTGHGTRQGCKQGTNRASTAGQDRCRPSAASLKPKDLCGIPQRLALALQAAGWYWRSEIIWAKPNPMPESVTDRPTKAHEQVLLFSKRERYFYDAEAVREEAIYGRMEWNTSAYGKCREADPHDPRPNEKGSHFTGITDRAAGRNLRTVWSIATEPTPFAHFATFPQALVERCIKAGTSAYGVCSACGAPFVREVTSRRLLDGEEVGLCAWADPSAPRRMPVEGKGHWRYTTERTDHGFAPSCACIATVRAAGERNPDVMDALSTPSPAIVFDPFVGSGTTPLVARALGRVGLGCDLSWPYLQIARQRLGLAALAAWEGRAAAPPPCAVDDLPLFQETTQ